MSPIAQSSLPNKLDIPLRLSALLVLFAGVSLGLFTLSSAVGYMGGGMGFSHRPWYFAHGEYCSPLSLLELPRAWHSHSVVCPVDGTSR